MPEALETLKADRTSAAVMTSAIAEILASARSRDVNRSKINKICRTYSSTRENWNSREHQQQRDPETGGKARNRNIINSRDASNSRDVSSR
jgi:hypothetical protein